MDFLTAKLNEISPLSKESEAEFLTCWKHWTFSKNHLLVKQHAISDYLYFIDSGSARVYYIKEEKEITEWIAMDREFFLSLTSFYLRAPSQLIIQTIEPTEIYGIHHDDLMNLVDKHRDIERLLRNMMTGGFILAQQRLLSLQFESARQRYDALMKQHPNMIQRVPLGYIASFLGITPETLSRTRGMK